MEKFDFRNTRVNAGEVADAVNSGEKVKIFLSGGKLKTLLLALKESLGGVRVEFEPTNAATREICLNTVGGAILGGVGGGVVSYLLRAGGYAFPPLGIAILLGGLGGGAAGFFVSRYKIKITKRGDDIFEIDLHPAQGT